MSRRRKLSYAERLEQLLDVMPWRSFSEANKPFKVALNDEGEAAVAVAKRKLRYGLSLHEAISSVHGTNRCKETVRKARENLLRLANLDVDSTHPLVGIVKSNLRVIEDADE